MEMLDIRRKDGSLTGQVRERTQVHTDGDLHGTSHVWIIRRTGQNRFDILLQKRAATKDAYAGCYDISSAGHIPAGQDYRTSACRELQEELGITAAPEQLHFIGMHDGYMEAEFYGKPFRNHELSAVYIYEEPVTIEQMTLQVEEVESVRWIDFDTCWQMLRNGEIENCIFEDEFQMLDRAVRGGQKTEPAGEPQC